MLRRAIFCRIGWMKYYDGKKAGDLKPVGGGSWNKTHPGGEIFNFREMGGLYFGFCQPSWSNNINLERIDPNCQENILQEVLVIFVAVDPERGRQRVVGWYGNATVYRLRQKSTSERRERIPYFAVARVSDSVLLPVEPYERDVFVKAGPGGIGEANACYLYGENGRPKNFAWQKQILGKIQAHRSRRT
jgi:hypothetical protein